MSVLRPTSYIGNGGNNTWLRHGGSTIDGVVADLDDATWDFVGGESITYTAVFGFPTIDHTIDPTTRYINIKMRRIAVPDTGFTGTTKINVTVTPDDGSGQASANVFFLAALLNGTASGGDFLWYSQPLPGAWSGSGGSANTIRFDFIADVGNACELDIAEVSFGDNEAIANYPQAGAASVTMTGSSTHIHNEFEVGGASVTMSGSSTKSSTLHTVTGSGTITNVDPHTVAFVPGQGQTVGHVIIDGVDLGPILTYTFSDDAADHIIVVTFVTAIGAATSYTYGLLPGEGMNREDLGNKNTVESHPEKNAANAGPRGFVPMVRHFVPMPKDFI